MTNTGAGIGGRVPADPRNGAHDQDSAVDGSGPWKAEPASGARMSVRRVCIAVVGLGMAMVFIAVGMSLQHFLDNRAVMAAPIAESASNAAPADTHAGDFAAANAANGTSPRATAPSVASGLKLTLPPLAASDALASPAIAIHIPRLKLSKSLVDLHVQADRSMSVPQKFTDVGWWSEGPRPGGPGATLIAAHVDSRTGPAVFYRLKDMQRGDLVTVDRADHTSVVFKVVGKASYPRSEFPDEVVYRVRGKPSIHLLTCDALDAATGHHTANLVVFADLVSTGPTKHPVR